MIKYTDTHEWIALDNVKKSATFGITQYAQKELGEIVYVELPPLGKRIEQGEQIVILESTKAAIDLYTPLSGTVVEVNTLLFEQPELINNDPLGKGWLVKLEPADPSQFNELLDEKSYRALSSE